MKPLITPTINLNGNSSEFLVAHLRMVLDSIDKLTDAMREASDIGHGRNFQTAANGEEKARQARAAWHERQLMVATLYNEVTDLAIEIQLQGKLTGWTHVEGGATSP